MLEFHEVSKFFPAPHLAEGSLKALERISLEIREGDFLAVVGPSGCGKSTLLRLAAGLEFPEFGEVVFGVSTDTGTSSENLMLLPIRGPSMERAMMFQQDSLFPWLTVHENASFAVHDAIRREPGRRAGVDGLLRQVGLLEFANAYPHQLSGGMRQRLALARSLALHPRILLLDEPFGAVDALIRLQLQRMLGDILESSHTTAMLVTHDIEEAIALANRIIILTSRPGRMLREVRGGYLDTLWRSRQRKDTAFQELRLQITDSLASSETTTYSQAHD